MRDNNSITHPTVLAVHLRTDGMMGGCEQYRIRIPYDRICDRVEDAYLDWVSMRYLQDWTMSKMGIMPTDYDIIVLVRARPLPYGEDGTPRFDEIPDELKQGLASLGIQLERKSHLLDAVKLLKHGGQKVVLEYDDDHWTGSRDLGYDYLPLVRELLNAVDAITVSTPYMRKIAQKYAPGVPVYILPNTVEWDEWQGHARWDRWKESHVVIGLTGSPTHDKDWKVVANVIPRVLAENENACFLLRGFVPEYFEPTLAQYPERIHADASWRPYEQYPEIVRQEDIVLCPLDPDDSFNKAKSAIKAIEGFAAGRLLTSGQTGGAAVIASSLNFYGRVVGWGNKRGIIVRHHRPEGWYEAITQLVQDKALRETYQRKGHVWAQRNRTIATVWKQWWAAYQKIYKR